MTVDVEEGTRTGNLPRFVAVIFANGEDDDGPGLIAAASDEPVQLDERVYEPGEDVIVEGRTLYLPDGVQKTVQTIIAAARVHLRSKPGRTVVISWCTFTGPL